MVMKGGLDVKRILVLGISAGVGKTTFATQLGRILNKKVYHLDALFWKPGWVEASLEEFSNAQKQIIENTEEWIIEGNYSTTYDLRMKAADTLIYLECPLYVCLYRVIKRYLSNIGKTRPDMGEGCTEKLDWEFIKFIITTYKPRKKKMEKRLSTFKSIRPQNQVITLKNRKAIRSFLKSLEATHLPKVEGESIK